MVVFLLETWMGVLEVAVLAMVGRMVALGVALGARMVPGYWSLRMG